MPPKAKAKNAPNQHDKRHENGLAAPGRRISKQRSSGQLNAQSNGKTVSQTTTPPALPTTGLNQGFRFPRSSDAAANPVDRSYDPNINSKEHVEGREPGVKEGGTDRVSDDHGGRSGEITDNASTLTPSLTVHDTDGGPSSNQKMRPAAGGSTLSTISTILAYCPLRDAIAILILLLSLPPTIVLIIQTLFTLLTSIPPHVSLPLGSLVNLKDISSAANLGYPALATTFIVDILFWVCWLPIWTPLQNIFLDLSHAVIAISLSGAASSTGDPTYSIATCTIIVGLVHVLQYKVIHITILDTVRSLLHRVAPEVRLGQTPLSTSFVRPLWQERSRVSSSFRIGLGIHIVAQGFTACVRRLIVSINERDQNLAGGPKIEAESNSVVELHTRPSLEAVQMTTNTVSSVAEGRAIAASVSRDSKSRESISKKKKKQGTQARSQQPLWAAIATTKVTVAKELELRTSVDDANDGSVMEGSDRSTVNRVWLVEIGSSDLVFGLDLSDDSVEEFERFAKGHENAAAPVDTSKPIFVRVNGATWNSVRIVQVTVNGRPAIHSTRRFSGEIFGLAPLSTYCLEIVGVATGQVLCSTRVITQARATSEQATALPVVSQHTTLRPSSPTSTLKQSIASAEIKLNETRNRTRKSKKDHRGAHADIRKEINTLRIRSEQFGALDERQEKRVMQLTQHRHQAEEATADTKHKIDHFGDVPVEETAEAEAHKQTYQAALKSKSAADTDFENAKADADREVGNLRADLHATENKREKLMARSSQRASGLEKLLAKQQADTMAKQKRESDRAQLMRGRRDEEAQIRFHISSMDNETAVLQHKTQEAYHQIAALQSWATQPPPAYPGYSSPPTPESVLPNSMGMGLPTSNYANYNLPTLPNSLQTASTNNAPNAHAPRGRSSSMLSQYSGFTDDGQDFQAPHRNGTWSGPAQNKVAFRTLVSDDRSNSEGSETHTNGSAGSNSPRPDARTFVPGSKIMGPIGPPSRLKSASSVSESQSPSQSPGVVGSGR